MQLPQPIEQRQRQPGNLMGMLLFIVAMPRQGQHRLRRLTRSPSPGAARPQLVQAPRLPENVRIILRQTRRVLRSTTQVRRPRSYTLTPEMTPDYDERTELTTYRMFFNLVISLVVAVAAPMIKNYGLASGLTLQQSYLMIAGRAGFYSGTGSLFMNSLRCPATNWNIEPIRMLSMG